jgi:hypothetical protein
MRLERSNLQILKLLQQLVGSLKKPVGTLPAPAEEQPK